MNVALRDRVHMARALRLAAKGQGTTGPNPMVGAVVVKNGRIVGEGFHRYAGGPHAELLALKQAGARAKGATLYVTLEPCCHTEKRTPPCVPAVVAAGIARVVAAMQDPNPRVSGRGLRALRAAGVAVTVGCLRAEAEALNVLYGYRMKTGLPYVVLKAGMTLDGKIATAAGESQWITGPEARRDAHRLRAEADAVLVGVDTVLHDDPQLTVRLPGRQAAKPARHPLRVILDSRLRIPLSARVLRAGDPARKQSLPVGTLILTTARAPRTKIARLQRMGVDVVVCPSDKGRVSFRAGLRHVAKIGVASVLAEGGSEVNATAVRSGLVNRVVLYLAPMLLGGQDAKGLIGGSSPTRLSRSLGLTIQRLRRLGSDVVIEAIPAKTR